MGLFDRFTKPPQIVKDCWNGYAYRFGEEERCIVTFDETACDPDQQRESQLRRVIGFSPRGEIGPTGMPSAPAFARLVAIEKALIEELTKRRVKCWLIGKQVYRGFRELLFQVDDLAGFAKAYATIEAQFGGTELVEHDDWKFFNDKLKPKLRDRNHMGNREVIEAVKKAGSNIELEHMLDHTFVGPPDALDAIAAELDERDFEGKGRGEKSLTMSHAAMLEQDAIDDVTMSLHELAAEHGAKYDGWGCAIVKA